MQLWFHDQNRNILTVTTSYCSKLMRYSICNTINNSNNKHFIVLGIKPSDTKSHNIKNT